ncbi:hypothetical protein LH19_26435 (plasmid) [Sphingopyxis macrogoltabida]|nr:hypothetical protein LH19_26435 [Sphingopyxis macrogoltabida]
MGVGGGEGQSGRLYLGWRMVILAIFSQTCAVGLAYGINGSMVTWVQAEFNTTRALASAGMPAILLTQALVAPFIGDLLRRKSIRLIMMTGAALFAIGHAALYFVSSIYAFIAIYACLLGPAYCMLSHVATSTLVINWFGDKRGRALGIANIPIALFLFPPIIAAVMLAFGPRAVFAAGALLSLGLIPLLAFVISRPGGARGLPSIAGEGTDVRADEQGIIKRRDMLKTVTFWIIWFGNGTFVAAGATMAIVLVPYALSKGIALEWAAVALSCYGLGSMVGAPTWGVIVDRAGPSRTFVLLATLEAITWTTLFLFGGNAAVIMVVGGIIGFCSGGAAVPLLTATLGVWLDERNFSRGLGLLYLLKLPFSAGIPIVSGVIFDLFGSYQLLLVSFVVLMLLNAALFSFLEIRRFVSSGEASR